MQLDTSMILDLLRQQGRGAQADQAQQELPDKVDTDRDTDRHAGLLENFGLNPQDLIAKVAGGGGLAGGLGGLLGGGR